MSEYHWDLNRRHKVRYFYPGELGDVLKRIRKFEEKNTIDVESVDINRVRNDEGPAFEAFVIYTGWVEEN